MEGWRILLSVSGPGLAHSRERQAGAQDLFCKRFTDLGLLARERLAITLAGPEVAPRLGQAVSKAGEDRSLLMMEALDLLNDLDFGSWTPELWAELGALLRRLHGRRVAAVGPLGQSEIHDWQEFLAAYLDARGSAVAAARPDLAPDLGKVVNRAISALLTLRPLSLPALLHRDIRPHNLGRSRVSRALRLFDFEHAWGGDPMLDLAVIFMDSSLAHDSRSSEIARAAFLSSYDPDFPRDYFMVVACPLYAIVRSVGAIAYGLRCADDGVLGVGLKGMEQWFPKLPK